MTDSTAARFLVAFVVSSAAPVLAGPYSELLVFGDSLSDIGNVAQSTLGIQPGPFYYEGRFSNGPVYAELLATSLGLGVLEPSADGGGNFANGGAQTSGSGFFAGLFIDDVDEQVDDFLADRLVDPNALVVVWIGANDLFNGQTDVAAPVNQIAEDLQRLIAAHGRNFLVMNLPPLGVTPRFNRETEVAASMNALTFEFNIQLSAMLDELEETHSEISLFRLDVAELIGDAIADPAAFGLENVDDPAAPGLASGNLLYDSDLIVRDPSLYLFWDEIHPTTATHARLAEHALAAVLIPADFDFDGDVDGEDLLQWQDDFGQSAESDADRDGDSDGADFLVWQRRVEGGALPDAPSAVPEPSTIGLAVAIVFAGAICRSLSERSRGSNARQ